MLVAWVCGPPAAGKSTVAWQLYRDLANEAVRSAYVDIDQLGMMYPSSVDDSQRYRIKGQALAAVAANYAAVGTQVLMVSGVLDPADTAWLRAVVRPAEVVFIMLRADEATLRTRVDKREGDAEDWAAVLAEARAYDSAPSFGPVVDTAGLPVAAVVAGVRYHVNVPAQLDWGAEWRGPSRSPGNIVWLAGCRGVGKSTVGWQLFMSLRAAGHTTGYLDLQQLSFVSPAPDDDSAFRAAQVGAIWDVFQLAGATDLVLSGAADGDALKCLRKQLPSAGLASVLLTADAEALAERLRRRAGGDGPRLAGDDLIGQPSDVLVQVADAARATQRRLADSGAFNHVIDTSGRGPREIAATLLRADGPAARTRRRPNDHGLDHVRWLGGGTGAGKSAIASRLGHQFGLRVYTSDDAIAAHIDPPGEDAPLLSAFLASDMDERWAQRNPRIMLQTFPWFAGERFDRIVSDLRAPPTTPMPLTLAEGFRLLPRLVAPLLGEPWHAVWLTTTPEFRRRSFEARPQARRFWLHSSEPALALERLLERDAIFDEHVAHEARALGLTVVVVDGSRSEAEVAADVAACLRL